MFGATSAGRPAPLLVAASPRLARPSPPSLLWACAVPLAALFAGLPLGLSPLPRHFIVVGFFSFCRCRGTYVWRRLNLAPSGPRWARSLRSARRCARRRGDPRPASNASGGPRPFSARLLALLGPRTAPRLRHSGSGLRPLAFFSATASPRQVAPAAPTSRHVRGGWRLAAPFLSVCAAALSPLRPNRAAAPSPLRSVFAAALLGLRWLRAAAPPPFHFAACRHPPRPSRRAARAASRLSEGNAPPQKSPAACGRTFSVGYARRTATRNASRYARRFRVALRLLRMVARWRRGVSQISHSPPARGARSACMQAAMIWEPLTTDASGLHLVARSARETQRPAAAIIKNVKLSKIIVRTSCAICQIKVS